MKNRVKHRFFKFCHGQSGIRTRPARGSYLKLRSSKDHERFNLLLLTSAQSLLAFAGSGFLYVGSHTVNNAITYSVLIA